MSAINGVFSPDFFTFPEAVVDLLRSGPHTGREPSHVVEKSFVRPARFPYWHQFRCELDLSPRGGGRTPVIWGGRGPKRWLQVPSAVPCGAYQANWPRFVRLLPLLKQTTSDADTRNSGVSSSFRSVSGPVRRSFHTSICVARPWTARSHQRSARTILQICCRTSL